MKIRIKTKSPIASSSELRVNWVRTSETSFPKVRVQFCYLNGRNIAKL
jgi:hypothetical protein